jgi:hypothetical protein
VITSLNSINQFISVIVKCGVLFGVRSEFLNIIYTIFGFKDLNSFQSNKWRVLTFTVDYTDVDLLTDAEVIIEYYETFALHRDDSCKFNCARRSLCEGNTYEV